MKKLDFIQQKPAPTGVDSKECTPFLPLGTCAIDEQYLEDQLNIYKVYNSRQTAYILNFVAIFISVLLRDFKPSVLTVVCIDLVLPCDNVEFMSYSYIRLSLCVVSLGWSISQFVCTPISLVEQYFWDILPPRTEQTNFKEN